MKQALRRAIAIAGGPAALAAAVPAAASSPTMWISRGNVPVRYRPGIERASHGAVSVEEFGDDVSWVRVKDRSWPHPDGRPLADFSAR